MAKMDLDYFLPFVDRKPILAYKEVITDQVN